MLRMTWSRAANLLALALLMGTSAATSSASGTKPDATPRLMVFGGRSAEQLRSGSAAKLDAALADLARHTERMRPGTAMVHLRSMNPAARFIVAPDTGVAYVAADAITLGDPQRLKSALLRLGLQHASVYSNDVGGWLPVQSIAAATRLSELHSIRAAMSRTHAGAVTTQGDFVQGTSTLRAGSGVDGTGVTVGILSDSYDCYFVYARSGSGVPPSGQHGYASNGITTDAAMDISSGDLPASANINILEEAGALNHNTCMDFGAPMLLPYGDEGRAMMQVVHDVAPGAKLAFHTAVESEADFANGIQALAAAGAQVIADDVSYFTEPFFQDGLLNQAVDSVYASGVAYFSAAGNSGSNAYDNIGPSFATPSTSPVGELLLNFDTTNATSTTALTVNVPALQPGDFIAIVLQWDQPYVTGAPHSGGATTQLDLCVTGSNSGLIASPGNTTTPLQNQVQVCTGGNALGSDPVQVLVIGNPADASGGGTCMAPLTGSNCTAAQSISLQVGMIPGGAALGRLKLAVDDNGAGATILSYGNNGATLHGHAGASGAMAVGAAFWDRTAACGTSPAQLDPYSAKGGDPIIFDSSGTRIALPVARQKPDIVGPDGGSNTFLGQFLGAGGTGQCMNSSAYPNFFGTSAATPHVAATAALFLQHLPGLAPAAVYTALRDSAAPVTNTPGHVNYDGSNYGFIAANAALGLLPQPPTLTFTLNPTTINVGESSTLHWTATNADTCTASGAWSGNEPLSNSLPVQPTSAGTYSYTLTCTNTNGLARDTQVLTVVTPASGGGGGGGGTLDLLALLSLGAFAARSLVRRPRR